MATSPDVTERLLAWVRIDFSPPHRPPAWWRVAIATVLSIVGSLLADAVLVAIGTHVFPATKGYVHFGFADYANLTVIGVLVAGIAWPVVVRMSSAPRWLFFRLAVVVTLVLFLPDVYIWLQGQSAQAVAVLMAIVTPGLMAIPGGQVAAQVRQGNLGNGHGCVHRRRREFRRRPRCQAH